MRKKSLRVVLARPRGFCAGVVRAVEIVERALERYGAPVYVRHEIVHNKHVVDSLRAKGAIFVEEVDEIPQGAVTIFSAHGVSRRVETDAGLRGLDVIDATCPLVGKVHKEAQRYVEKGFEIALIGHRGHPEVVGTMGQVSGRVHLVSEVEDVSAMAPANPEKLAFVTQTTLSVDDTRHIIDALRDRFPAIVGPDVKDICYATQNRQTAVRLLAKSVDVVLVVGANYSSNSNRLRELAEELGIPGYLIADAGELDLAWLDGVGTVGITAGASAPEELVTGVIDALAVAFDVAVSDLDGIDENVHFKLPAILDDVETGSLRQDDLTPA
ncbi:MAG: 4-hydroxy-3-methylbut-2-enyl diphosphate reductase [Rhodospirillaceae bacterium]|jgi:4-hydroxy-3-methylbut-2-en-1-yl diphosphate reductase|nr:4-hydroxy-3-methylbut-2-enyl diphosphate reductase [Rhodospirillaceae bacterium]MBT5666982.1 4-hydroxy-3-methylbut-2-enyl diphosphate reductase [Rhodospirillaceae bacterium]MBT5811792.1 4-hydroxy-3-methylbut-2-enyl diphosphate reductase [Rhodospirillaceae bacterium]